MDTKKREALEASIKHWQENVAAVTPDDASTNGEDCALCDLFFEYDCIGCPVRERTGEEDCLDSPYHLANNAYGEWYFHNDEDSKAAWRKAAQAELDFLISLRPE